MLPNTMCGIHLLHFVLNLYKWPAVIYMTRQKNAISIYNIYVIQFSTLNVSLKRFFFLAINSSVHKRVTLLTTLHSWELKVF